MAEKRDSAGDEYRAAALLARAVERTKYSEGDPLNFPPDGDLSGVLDRWATIVEREGEEIADLPLSEEIRREIAGPDVRRHVSPDRHAQRDFFVADLFDTSPKDDQVSMEHPLFALKAGDRTVREYGRQGYRVTVKPGPDGCATIHDKDIWIYAISQLVAAADRGRDIGRTVRFTAYDFLVSTNRQTSGEGYRLLGNALERLSGTRIETNIRTNGQRERGFFGLIDSARIVERDSDDRMVAVEITLPDWLYRAIEARQVLTLSRHYFRLRKPLDRRIYELARKHCGAQPKWRAKITTLHEKSGSRASRREFRRSIKKLSEARALPEYRMVFDATADAVTFYSKGSKGGQAQLGDLLVQLRR